MAMRDGFVKEPAVATRKDFDPTRFSNEELDRIKLEDGVKSTKKTKLELDIFHRDNKVKLVKPFVLVVAKETNHSAEIENTFLPPAFWRLLCR